MKDWDSITVDRYWEQITVPNVVGIGILDISRDIPNDVVRKRTFDMTYFYINRMLKMGMSSYIGTALTVEELLNNAIAQNKKYCMIACQGQLLYRGPSLITQSLKYAENNPDFFVIGHIMDKNEQKNDFTKSYYPGLHRQYLFVNLATWQKLGSPAFDEPGIFWDRKPELQNYELSADTVHSDYTPEWIQRAEGTAKYLSTSDGSNWINIACRNNIRIDNLTNDMRDCKIFLYPYSDTELLAQVWYDKRSPLVDQLSNQAQRAWLRKLGYQEEIEKDRVYAFNTETLSGEGARAPGPIDALISPAAGFKPLSILSANGFKDTTEVHYFDWCEASLNYKKELLETWDGLDLDKWLLDRDLKYNFSSTYRGTYKQYWDLEVSEHGGPEKFKELWDRYRKLTHGFHIVDIVNHPETLFDVINSCSGVRVLWTTNIWSSEMLHWNVEPEILEERWKHFQSLIPSDLTLYGHDYIAYDMQSRVLHNATPTHPRYVNLYDR